MPSPAAESDDRARIFQKIQSIFGERSRSYLGEDSKVTTHWKRYVIRYDLRDPVIQMRQLAQAIGRAEARITEVIGSFPERLTIEICQTEAELPPEGTGLSHFPGWIGGAFDGTIRVLSDPLRDGTPHSLYVFLTHEMVHAALAAAPGRALPCWFEEGLAVFMSQNLPGDYRAALADGLRRRRTFPLVDLESPFTRLAASQVPLAYAQAASVVEFLAERLGPERLRMLIDRARRRGLAAALRAESLTASLLEQDWRRWAPRRDPAP